MTLFCFRDWNNKKRHFTAKRLYKRIMKDSKSDYNWIASAAELVQVCERADFPKKYALEIELAILNCFANLELKRHIPSTHANNDEASVDFCYRAIIDANITNDPRINAVKHKYLKAIIAGVAVAVVLFSVQLYTDFSGCMDIILGVSEMFDIKLPENFDTPFF